MPRADHSYHVSAVSGARISTLEVDHMHEGGYGVVTIRRRSMSRLSSVKRLEHLTSSTVCTKSSDSRNPLLHDQYEV